MNGTYDSMNAGWVMGTLRVGRNTNPTCSNRIHVNFLQSEAVGTLKHAFLSYLAPAHIRATWWNFHYLILVLFLPSKAKHWWIQGALALPLGVQILSFSCSFRQKNLQNNRLAHPLWELAPPPRKILDPPLKRIVLCVCFELEQEKRWCPCYTGFDVCTDNHLMYIYVCDPI